MPRRVRVADIRREIADAGGGSRVVQVVVGTGHHTKAGQVRLPSTVRGLLEGELGLRVREPQAGLLEVVLR